MNKTTGRTIRAGICVAALFNTFSTQAAEVTLRAVSAWQENNLFSQNFEKFIQKVNAEGKGLVQINYLGGGAKVMPPFEVANAVKTGVIDMANVTGNYYTTILPESDALSASTVSAQEQRKNGAYEYINKLWNERLNVTYLGRSVDNMPYHLFLKKPITKPDLGGMRFRGLPIYRDFFNALNAQAVMTIPPGEMYTALERGVVDGYGFPVSGLFDIGLHEQTKYRVEPGFYNVEISVLVNLSTWNKLDEKQRAFLTKAAMWMEDLNLQNEKLWEAEKKRQASAGIQPIVFKGKEAENYVAKANDTLWSSIINRSPQHGPKLRTLLTK
jgi:TRAP-type C4-dicarboxylate transport system substrate-binding protein